MFKQNLLAWWNPFDWFNDLIQSIVDVFLNLWGEILKALYNIWATLASIIDAIQVIFGMLVGVNKVVWVDSSTMGGSQLGEVASNNIIISIFTHEYVYGAFIKILILSIFLLVIFTMIAIIKQEYSTSVEKAENNPMEIIKRSVRALVSFLCVPLVCIFGVLASGYLMQALDAATSVTGQTLISNKMFTICMQDASRVRTDSDFYESLMAKDGNGPYSLSNYAGKFPNLIIQSEDRNEVAQSIDDCFLYGKALPNGVSFGTNDRFSNFIRNGNGMNDDKFFNTKNPAQVFYYYDLTKFNWLIGFFTIFYIGAVMIRIVLGAAVRLYELAILFVVSPAIISLYPLDKGEALKKWQVKFIGKTTMIFAPVIALNLYFILVATLIQVDFSASLAVALEMEGNSIFTGISGFFLQQIYSIFILIAGLMVCEKSIAWLGEMIGAEDIDAAGKSLRGSIGETLQNSASAKYLMSKGASAKGKMQNAASRASGAVKDKVGTKFRSVRDRGMIKNEKAKRATEFEKQKEDAQNKFEENKAELDIKHAEETAKIDKLLNEGKIDEARAAELKATKDASYEKALRDLEKNYNKEKEEMQEQYDYDMTKGIKYQVTHASSSERKAMRKDHKKRNADGKKKQDIENLAKDMENRLEGMGRVRRAVAIKTKLSLKGHEINKKVDEWKERYNEELDAKNAAIQENEELSKAYKTIFKASTKVRKAIVNGNYQERAGSLQLGSRVTDFFNDVTSEPGSGGKKDGGDKK